MAKPQTLKQLVKVPINALAILLGIESPMHYYSKLARGNLEPAQVDGYLARHRDPNTQIFFAQTAAVLEELISDGDTVLDIGCGTGRYLRWLAERHSLNLYGIDVSEATLENYTRQHCPDTVLLTGDFSRRQPFTATRFDFVYSIVVLQLIPFFRVDKFFHNIAAVLKPGKQLYMVYAPGTHWTEMFQSTHFFRYQPAVIRRKLLAAGLRVDDEGTVVAPDGQTSFGYYCLCTRID